MSDWIDLGPVSDFPEGNPVLRKADGARFVCVRRGDAVHVLDDHCPHQGYPLSQGTVNGDTLTCQWHNWKFELTSGSCTFGGEPVRCFATRQDDGRVWLDPSLDIARERERLTAGLRAALVDDDAARALREGLRLGALVGPPAALLFDGLGPAFAVIARDGAERAEYGFDHGLALLADLLSWSERGWVKPDTAFALAVTAIAEPSRHLGLRPVPALVPDDPHDPCRVAAALAAERREEAEARVRALVVAQGAETTARLALLPFASQHFYDYGHGVIFLSKALELARRFPDAAVPIFAAATVELGWATAETALPPFAATQQALSTLAAKAPVPQAQASFDRADYETRVLVGERSAVDATLAALAAGVAPRVLLRALGHVAAVRLTRFDRAWEDRLEAEVGILDVTHGVTFIEAALALTDDNTPVEAARMAVIGAGFLGKIRRADRAAPAKPPSPSSHHATLLDAARARDLDTALGHVSQLDRAGRLKAYARLAPFAAFAAAVRPIFTAHTVKVCEALARLERDDPTADDIYLDALLCFIVPPLRERSFARIATVARKFLADSRPPETLY